MSRHDRTGRDACEVPRGIVSRRSMLLGGAGLLAAPALVRRAVAGTNVSGVLELFTSQGCSSCPPADALLADMVAEGEVLGLSYHVDYWDYLGWRDTLGSREATQRQYAYAKAFGRRGVYTPQAVVNGRSHHVGSREGEVRARLRADVEAGLAPRLRVVIERRGTAGEVIVEGATGEAADLVMVAYDDAHEQAIERGENRGRTITYRNPVRSFRTLAPLDGEPVRFDMSGTGAKVAILVQSRATGGSPGPILGAASITKAGR